VKKVCVSDEADVTFFTHWILAINLLKDKQPGTFLIRDSNSMPGAFGLALKVDKPPPGVVVKSGT
jgi:hypothetical protein